MEFQITDRFSFMAFLGLELNDNVPDEKTVWLFREELTNAKLIKPLFDQFASNSAKSKRRSRVEHVFGVQSQRTGSLLLRGIGIIRAKTKIGLRNLSYNLSRYAILTGGG